MRLLKMTSEEIASLTGEKAMIFYLETLQELKGCGERYLEQSLRDLRVEATY